MLLIGVGGLGCPAAQALAAQGVELGLIDGDVVERSNLPRQALFRETDLGRPKAEVAAERLRGRSTAPVSVAHSGYLDASNTGLVAAWDFVLDGTDSIAAKYLVHDAAFAHGIPLSHAGANGWTGQTMTIVPGASACLRCLFPAPPDADEVASCAAAGVVASVVNAVGALQACEALRYFRSPQAVGGRLYRFDGIRWRSLAVERSEHCPLCSEA